MSSDTNIGKKSKGRPPSLDLVSALDAAMVTFWKVGYDGASLTDLTHSMKLSRPSLYTAFGDKEELFLAALKRYGETVGSRAMEAFNAEACIETAVREFLKTSAKCNTLPGSPSGCLFASCATAVSQSNPVVGHFMGNVLKQSEDHLTARFLAETKAGKLTNTPTPSARAMLMIDFMTAQAVRARSGESRKSLLANLENRVAAVISPDLD